MLKPPTNCGSSVLKYEGAQVQQYQMQKTEEKKQSLENKCGLARVGMW